MALDVGKVTRAALPARLYRSRVRARPSSRRRHCGAPPFSFSPTSFLFAECLLFVALQPPPAHLLTLVRQRRQRPRAPQHHAKVFVSPATTVCECVRECSPGWFRHWYSLRKAALSVPWNQRSRFRAVCASPRGVLTPPPSSRGRCVALLPPIYEPHRDHGTVRVLLRCSVEHWSG